MLTSAHVGMQHWGTWGISQELGMALHTVTVLTGHPEKSLKTVCVPFLFEQPTTHLLKLQEVLACCLLHPDSDFGQQ